MAVISGITSTFSVDDSSGSPVDLSAYAQSFQLGTPTNLQDITSLSQSAIARLALLKDFTVSVTFGFGTAVVNALKADPTGGLRTTVVGIGAGPAATLTFESLLGNMQISRDQAGYATITADFQNGDGAVGVWS
jgi:hypothetical protein